MAPSGTKLAPCKRSASDPKLYVLSVGAGSPGTSVVRYAALAY
jgi:hypothetical protein